MSLSAHLVLNQLKKLRKKDKMWALLSIFLVFCNKFNTFNNI